MILFVAALGFGLGTFFLLKHSQESDFQSSFESFARETADIAENNAAMTFGQLKSLSTAITSVSQDSETESFPSVSVPHFDLRAREIADLTGIEMVLFVPFVNGTAQDKREWETFELANQDWILQDYAYRGWDMSRLESIPHKIYNYTVPQDFNDTRRGFVDADNFMEEVLHNLTYNPDGFSAPISQYGPGLMDTSLTMLDLFTHPIFKKEIVASLEYNVPVISEVEDLEFLLQHIQPNNETFEEHDYSLLRSFTLDPVKEDFYNTSKTVGFIVGVVPWNTFFRNLLPENVNGIVVKVTSDCGKNFTYVVNGGKEDWAAEGDWHDPQYDHMEQRHKFFWKDHHKGTSRHCHFDLLIYPSKEFAQVYQSNDPALYAFIVVATFLFTAVVFYFYDTYQSRKQKAVLAGKARAEAVVSSLFPKHVGDQLMEEQGNLRRSKNSNRGSTLSNSIHSAAEAARFDNGKRFQSKPIADLFPSATVMFADIAGAYRIVSNNKISLVARLSLVSHAEYSCFCTTFNRIHGLGVGSGAHSSVCASRVAVWSL